MKTPAGRRQAPVCLPDTPVERVREASHLPRRIVRTPKLGGARRATALQPTQTSYLLSGTARSNVAHPKKWMVPLRVSSDAQADMPSAGASGAICVQRFDDSLTSCNSHYVSHFAAFFIVARAKISIGWSCVLVSTPSTVKSREGAK